jgi:hypothetical protein
MCIEDNQPQDCDYDRQTYPNWIQEQVIQKNVHYYWSQEHQAQGHEPIHKQQQTAGDL